MSMYAAGVAVECMLRAFELLRDQSFDEKHDLLKLFRASGMLDIDPELLKRKGLSSENIENHFRELQDDVMAIRTLWSNDYRYAAEARLRAHLKQKNLDRGYQGDFLKGNARELFDSARVFIEKGVLQWNLLKKFGPS